MALTVSRWAVWVTRVFGREHPGYGPSGNIADHYTRVDEEVIIEMLVGAVNSCIVHD
jgi:hypothetical protein